MLRKISNNYNVDICKHPEHNPPTHIVLEPGIYEYTCPLCGKVTILNVPRIEF